MGRPKGTKNKVKPQPSNEVAVQPVSQVPEPVRPAIKNLSGQSEEDFAKQLPDNTNTETTQPTRRKYQRKQVAEPEIDPLMQDERYKHAVQNMIGFGGAEVIKDGFALTGKPLDFKETTDVEDFFYVLGKRNQSFDPTSSPWLLALFAVVLMLRLVMKRIIDTSEMMKQMQELFGMQPKKEEKKEEIQ